MGVLLGLTGCAAAPVDVREVDPLVGPAPVNIVTRMEDALLCLRGYVPSDLDLRLAVNDLTDGTGATLSGDSFSRALTQRPDVMLTVGLVKTGVRMVNRSSIAVAEWELKQAMQKHVGEGRVVRNPTDDSRLPYRPVMAGSMLGSTHYVSGALTEVNWNIYSDVVEGGVGGLVAGRRSYKISIAVDLIVTDTQTTEIVMARSYSKELIGMEVGADLFRFFDVGQTAANWGRNELFEFNIGRSQNEPVQTAVRWMLETAAYEIVSELTGVGAICDHLMPEESRPQRTNMVVRPSSRPASLTEGVATAPRAVQPSPQAPRQPAAQTAPQPPTASRPPENTIEAINLFDDAGTVIVRVDTRIPLDRVPLIDSSDPSRIVIDFVNASNGIGEFSQAGVSTVGSVRLDTYADGSRLVIQQDQPHRFELAREGNSFLVLLAPAYATAAGERLNEHDSPPAPADDTTTALQTPAQVPLLPDEALLKELRRR